MQSSGHWTQKQTNEEPFSIQLIWTEAHSIYDDKKVVHFINNIVALLHQCTYILHHNCGNYGTNLYRFLVNMYESCFGCPKLSKWTSRKNAQSKYHTFWQALNIKNRGEVIGSNMKFVLQLWYKEKLAYIHRRNEKPHLTIRKRKRYEVKLGEAATEPLYWAVGGPAWTFSALWVSGLTLAFCNLKGLFCSLASNPIRQERKKLNTKVLPTGRKANSIGSQRFLR